MSGIAGKRILITRPREQADGLAAELERLGAVPVLLPAIEIAPLEDPAALDRAIESLGEFRWVIFTSANGVTAFWARLSALGKDERALSGVRTAAIGPASARALMDRGVRPEFVPAEHIAEAILPGLGDVRGQRILLPRAEIAREALVQELRAAGADPLEIAAYRTLPARLDAAGWQELERGIDAATFTSSSTVRSFFEMAGGRAAQLLAGALIACIGPVTAETARACGLEVGITAAEYTAEGLVRALVAYYEAQAS
ncbi:MAG TPA: uroporphyrinogen-III synthase [Longimicrobiales bacterium]